MTTIKRKTALPIYAAAGTWLLYAAMFPLYRMSHFIFIGIASLAVFLLFSAICGTRTEVVPDKPKEEKPTGNEELDKMIKNGNLAVAEMKRLDDAIEDETISAQIVRLEELTGKIFDQVKANPEKVGEIRRFMDYYLPTTLKILNAYDRMDSQGVSGENISTTMQRVEGMMGTIVGAFEKQLDSLFGTEAMDISTDISVLETMMEREGLKQSAGDLHADTAAETLPGTDIKLEL